MNKEAIKKLYDALAAEYELGSIEEFTAYLMDDVKRKKFYEQIIEPNYDVESLEVFEQAYGLKKKEPTDPFGAQEPMESPTPQSQEPISLASSDEPSSPTAPIDPTTGQPFQDEETVDQAEVDFDTPSGEEQIDQTTTQITTPQPRDQTTETFGSGDFFIEGTQEDNTILEDVVGKNSVTDFISDIYRSMKSGFAQGNTADEANRLFLKGQSATDEEIMAFLETQDQLMSAKQTDEMLNFNKIYDAADNKFLGFLEGIGKNPSAILQIGAQTITQMINPSSAMAAGTVIGGGAAAGATAGAGFGGVGAAPGALVGAFNPGTLKLAFAAAGGALETGLSFAEFIREEIDKREDLSFDEAGIRAILEDEDAYKRARNKSIARGGSIAIIDRIFLGIGGKLAKRVSSTKKVLGVDPKKAATFLTTEAIGGGVGESTARALAGQDQDVREIGFETIGGVGKAPVSYVLNTVSSPVTNPVKDAIIKQGRKILFPAKYTLKDQFGETEVVTEKDVIEAIDNTDDVTFMGLDYKIENNPELKQRYDDRKMRIITGDNIRQKLEEAGITNEEQIEKIIDLEIEKNKYEGNNTEAGKERLKQIKNEIAELSGITEVTPAVETKTDKTDAVQESSTEKVDAQESTEDSPEVGIGDNVTELTEESTEETTPEGEQTTEVVEESQEEINPDAPIEGTDGRTVRQIANDIFVEEQKQKSRRGDRDNIMGGDGKESLFNEKFSYESLQRYFGGNPSEFIGARYIAKKNDPNAQNIEDGLEINGQQLSADDIVDFLSPYRTQKDIDAYFGLDNIDLNNFKAEFEKVTGLKPTKKNINKFLNMPEENVEDQVAQEEAEQKGETAENVELINEIENNILNNLNQGYKKGLRSIRRYLKTLKAGGKITTKQVDQILEKVTDEKAFTDDASKKKTVDEIKKIFEKADREAEQNTLRKKAARASKSLKRSIGRILADALSGKDISLETLLREVVTIDPSIIPAKVYQDYKDIINGLGERNIMLDNAEEAGVYAEKSRNIMEAMNEQESRVQELKSIFDSAKKILFKNGKIDLQKTLNDLVKKNIISQEDADLMQAYKNEINPKEESKPKTPEEIQAEKESLIDQIKKLTVDRNRFEKDSDVSFPFRKTREDIRELVKLLKDPKILEGMKNTDLKNLARLVNTLNKGYAPGIMSRLIIKMKAVRDSAPIITDIKAGKLKLPTIEGIYSKLKTFNPFNKQSKIYNAIERGQLYNIDRLFGDFNTKKMFEAFFNDMAEGQQQMEVKNKKERKLRDRARRLIEKTYSKLTVVALNKVAEADARIMFYRIQKEFESNPNNKEVTAAIDWLDATIKYLEANRLFDKQDARELEVLKKIREDYNVDNFNIDDVYNKFSKNEKEAIKILEKIDNDNAANAVYAANNRDAAFVPRQNYVHISVRPKSRERVDINKDVIDNFIQSTDNYRRPSTKDKSGIERTGQVNPIYTSALNSSERGSKFTNLDYYMTTPVRKAKETFKTMRDKIIEDYNGSPPKEVQAFLNSLEKGINQSIQNTLAADFVENNYMQMVSAALQRLGYRTMLASVPRAGVEYLSNMAFAALHPQVFYSGISKKNKLSTEELSDVLQNLKSKVLTRLLGENLMSSKVDVDILNKKSYKSERFVSTSKEKIVGLWDASGKKFKNAVALIADTLISSPDKIVMKPMYLGKLSETFKKITGNDIDYKKISENDENYMNENKEALQEAVKEADEFVTLIGSSDNPFMSRLQGKDAKGLAQVWVNFNNFMTTFLKQEFDTSVIGLQALAQNSFGYGDSKFTRAEGAKLLAAVTTRMTAYSLGIKVAGELMLELLDVKNEDDEEKDMEQQVGQALATTFTSLLLGRNFGNAFKTIQNYNIELLNAEFGDALRDGEYDQYRDAIQYNIIPLVKTGQDYKSGRGLDAGKIAPNFLGPYSPPVKTLAFATRKLTEPDRKTSEARERQVREREQRIPIEILGNTGFVPLYRDVRKVLLADIYKGLRNEKKSGLSREELEKLKIENPRKYKDVMYQKKLERYERAYKNFIDYKRSPRTWRDANPNKKPPRRPKRPRR
tara:strand:+ start:8898 stop:15071 length:6174 start_codon:yes stop_codon:yes gene_type:complete